MDSLNTQINTSEVRISKLNDKYGKIAQNTKLKVKDIGNLNERLSNINDRMTKSNKYISRRDKTSCLS